MSGRSIECVQTQARNQAAVPDGTGMITPCPFRLTYQLRESGCPNGQSVVCGRRLVKLPVQDLTIGKT